MKKIVNKFESIQISKIIYQDRLRKVSDAHVEALKKSIEEHGLQTPLLINQIMLVFLPFTVRSERFPSLLKRQSHISNFYMPQAIYGLYQQAL